MSDGLVTIALFGTEAEAHEARIELDSADIECVVADSSDLSINVFSGLTNVGGVALLVDADDVDRAVEILAATPAADDLVVKPEDGDGAESVET
jgi:hypothetical protein